MTLFFIRAFRRKDKPSKSLLKKFVRSVAARYGHAGTPWIVQDDVLGKYEIKKTLDPEMAERVRLLMQLRQQKDRDLSKRATATKDSIVKASDEPPLKYPVLDEFVPSDRQTDPLLWPTPNEFNPAFSIVSAGMIPQILELWQFIHAFRSAIQLAPVSLDHLMSSIEHVGEHNPFLEALCSSFLNHFTRNVRTTKTREERVSQYMGSAPVADLPPFSTNMRLGDPSIQADDITEDLLDESKKLDDFFDNVPKRETTHWSWKILEFLWDIRKIPESQRLLSVMRKKDTHRFCELTGAEKLMGVTILIKFYLSCVSLRPAVDRDLEIIIDRKHKIRECEAELRKLYLIRHVRLISFVVARRNRRFKVSTMRLQKS